MENLKEYVLNYPTKNKEGFTNLEISGLMNEIEEKIDLDKFNSVMYGNTCMMIDNEIINYHHDVLYALRSSIVSS